MSKLWVVEMWSRWGYVTVKYNPNVNENSLMMGKVFDAIDDVLGKENIIILWEGYEEAKKE